MHTKERLRGDADRQMTAALQLHGNALKAFKKAKARQEQWIQRRAIDLLGDETFNEKHFGDKTKANKGLSETTTTTTDDDQRKTTVAQEGSHPPKKNRGFVSRLLRRLGLLRASGPQIAPLDDAPRTGRSAGKVTSEGTGSAGGGSDGVGVAGGGASG